MVDAGFSQAHRNLPCGPTIILLIGQRSIHGKLMVHLYLDIAIPKPSIYDRSVNRLGDSDDYMCDFVGR